MKMLKLRRFLLPIPLTFPLTPGVSVVEEDEEFKDDEKFEKFWQAAHPVFVVATICYCVHFYHCLFQYFDFTKQESQLGLYITNIR